MLRITIGLLALTLVGAGAQPANGITSMPMPDFLASCSRDAGEKSDCASVVSAVVFYLGVTQQQTRIACIPDDVDVETRAVVAWLQDHPETGNMIASAGVATALRNMYPCKPQP